MARNFRSEDEGKRVVTAGGDTIGTVERVSGSTAHVQPDEDLSRSIRRRLGGSEEGETIYELQNANVERVTDEEILLREDI